MSEARYKVTHTDYSTAVTTDITEAIDVSTREGIETTIDSFSIRISERGLGALVIDTDDVIKIYLGRGRAAPTTLIMDGVVNSIKYNVDFKGKTYTIGGVNKLEHIMNNVIPAAYSSTSGGPDGDGWTASQIITELINRVNDFNTGLKDSWTNIGTGEITATTTKTDYYDIEKSVFQHIETLSTNEYTKNGDYIYYLDTSNNFVWKARPDDADGSETATIEEGVDAISIKLEKGIFNIINALIINCGVDLNGRKITAYAIRADSIGRHGFKWKYIGKTGFATNYIAANPSATNQEVRTNARNNAKSWALDVLEKLGAARYKAVIEVRGGSYTKGDAYKIQMRDYTFNTGNKYYNLRLLNIRHNYSSKEGWITTLEFEEDEDTALANLT